MIKLMKKREGIMVEPGISERAIQLGQRDSEAGLKTLLEKNKAKVGSEINSAISKTLREKIGSSPESKVSDSKQAQIEKNLAQLTSKLGPVLQSPYLLHALVTMDKDRTQLIIDVLTYLQETSSKYCTVVEASVNSLTAEVNDSGKMITDPSRLTVDNRDTLLIDLYQLLTGKKVKGQNLLKKEAMEQMIDSLPRSNTEAFASDENLNLNVKREVVEIQNELLSLISSKEDDPSLANIQTRLRSMITRASDNLREEEEQIKQLDDDTTLKSATGSSLRKDEVVRDFLLNQGKTIKEVIDLPHIPEEEMTGKYKGRPKIEYDTIREEDGE